MGCTGSRRKAAVAKAEHGYISEGFSNLTPAQVKRLAKLFTKLADKAGVVHFDALEDWVATKNATVPSSMFFPFILRLSEPRTRAQLSADEFLRLVERVCLVDDAQFTRLLFQLVATSYSPLGHPLLDTDALAGRCRPFATARAVPSSSQGILEQEAKRVVSLPLSSRALHRGQPRTSVNFEEFLAMVGRSGLLLHGATFFREFLQKRTLGTTAWADMHVAWRVCGKAAHADGGYFLDVQSWPALHRTGATWKPLGAAAAEAPPPPPPPDGEVLDDDGRVVTPGKAAAGRPLLTLPPVKRSTGGGIHRSHSLTSPQSVGLGSVPSASPTAHPLGQLSPVRRPRANSSGRRGRSTRATQNYHDPFDLTRDLEARKAARRPPHSPSGAPRSPSRSPVARTTTPAQAAARAAPTSPTWQAFSLRGTSPKASTPAFASPQDIVDGT